MTLIDGLILGLVQGLTEFLPVSSSGHLVLAQELLEVEFDGVWLEVAVHLGTLLSVLLYFRQDVRDIAVDTVRGGERRRDTWLVAAATLPIVVLALVARDEVRELLGSPKAAAGGLLVTGVWLLVTKFASEREGRNGIGTALLVGLAQACAVAPGVSRSGATIGAALLLGQDPDRAARFSFLLAIPAIAGAGILQAADGGSLQDGTVLVVVVATAVAFASGLAAIHVLMKMVMKGKLALFGPYCLLVGGIGLALL